MYITTVHFTTAANTIKIMDLFETATHSSVDKLLDSFHLAAENHNLKDYFGCFHRNGTFLGSDATEHWTVDKFLEFSRPHFISGEGWTYRPIHGSRKFHILEGGNENTPIICTFDELVKSKSFGITFRGSGTLVKDSSKKFWFILSYHLSIPIPNEWAGSSSFSTTLNSYEVVSKEAAAAEKAAAELLAEIEREEEERRDKPSSSSTSKSKKKKGKGK